MTTSMSVHHKLYSIKPLGNCVITFTLPDYGPLSKIERLQETGAYISSTYVEGHTQHPPHEGETHIKTRFSRQYRIALPSEGDISKLLQILGEIGRETNYLQIYIEVNGKPMLLIAKPKKR